MPTPPLVPKVYQVTTFGTLNGLACDHVINYEVLATPGTEGSVCETFTTADTGAWIPRFGSVLPSWYTNTAARCVYLGDLSVPPAETLTSGIGTSTGTFGPHNTCVTARHPVPVRGRGKDGRTNWPGPPTLYLEEPSGQINTSGLVAYLNAWTNYQSDINSAIFAAHGVTPTLVVLDRKLGTFNIPSATAIDILPNTHRRWQKRLSRHR
jgi:hypothetical protein